jgi:putative ABC transport system substrate-binding protein
VRRRTFITLVGGAAAGWPLAARAQRAAMPVIGILGSESYEMRTSRFQAFWLGLQESGYVDGRNLMIEYLWAEGRLEQYAVMASQLVGRQVSLIATLGGIPAARAAKAATSTIPNSLRNGRRPSRRWTGREP